MQLALTTYDVGPTGKERLPFLMGYTIAVCAAAIHLRATHKLLLAEHFGKPLTLHAGVIKGKVRPAKASFTG